MLINEVRQYFPAVSKWIYMDVAARGISSLLVRKAADKYLDDVDQNGGTKNLWFQELENTRSKFSRLINCSPNEVSYTKNVSEGINIIANAFPWKKGDNVVICPDVEHPNNVYVWLNLQRLGVEVRLVPSIDGQISPDLFANYIDKNTRLISVSSVSFVPGQRIDLKGFSRLCRENDIFLMVDAAQSCGILDINVNECEIDALTCSTHKGILGHYGMGFLYCNHKWIKRLQPVYVARYSIDLDNKEEEAIGDLNFNLYNSGQRFEIGNYNYLGIFTAGTALDLLLSVGTRQIEEHVLSLSGELTSKLLSMGYYVSSVSDEKSLSHIVTVGKWGQGDHYTTNDRDLSEMYDYLTAHNVKTSLRRGLIRFSLHCYNDLAEINKVLNLMDMKRKSLI
jgi:cysteine desulfurase / selenocysteine lyase